MAYTKQTWVDGSAGGTPVSAARLNHIEQGVADVDQQVAGRVQAMQTGLKLWKGTQAEFDAVATKDANTVYVIAG